MEIKRAELICHTGKIVVQIGDRFDKRGVEWVICGFGDELKYDPAYEGGNPVVYCKPVAEPDGRVGWCGDSVAALVLTAADGKPRDARGYFLQRKT